MNTTETIQQFFERIVAASRNRKTPSSRNRRIADEVWVNGRTQTDVAAEYGLSQRRISQICQQVDRWYSETEAWERGELCGGTEQRFESELARRQLTEIYRRAMRGHARSEKPLVTRRSRTSEGATMWSEETEREQRQDTGSLRVAMRAIEQRTKLDRRGEPMPVCGRVQYFEWALGALANLRAEAERRGEVPRSLEGPHALVERIVREILGGAGGERQVSREGETPAQPQALLGKPNPVRLKECVLGGARFEGGAEGHLIGRGRVVQWA
jgi:hypothetical protein